MSDAAKTGAKKSGTSKSGARSSGTAKSSTRTPGTGASASGPATGPTDVDPRAYIDSLETPRRRVHGHLLLDIYSEVTGEPPVMWGPTMIGYGTYDYTYASGWSGTYFRSGFAPRKAALSLYGLPQEDDAPELWARFGKHRRGASCVYVNKPEDIDLDVLCELIRIGWESDSPHC